MNGAAPRRARRPPATASAAAGARGTVMNGHPAGSMRMVSRTLPGGPSAGRQVARLRDEGGIGAELGRALAPRSADPVEADDGGVVPEVAPGLAEHRRPECVHDLPRVLG